MDIDNTITEILIQYQLPAIFFGAFFFGETVVVTAAYLAAQGLWGLPTVFALAFLGTIVSDSLWFLLGQRIFIWLNRWEAYKNNSEQLLKNLDKYTGEKPFFALLFIKFLYGTRILTIVYLSMRNLPFRTFLLFNTLGTIIWLFVIIGMGWLAGKSIVNLAPFLNRFEVGLVVIIILLILIRIGTKWASKKVIKS